ncbi:MAG: thiamine diphosphokinase [Syntrophales bacterium]|nr:thiamine diphosphokinase [Syntrophales bacterium]
MVTAKKMVFVVSGGQARDLALLHANLKVHAGAEIICADGGARHLRSCGLIPDVIIGDMDSLDHDEEEYFEEMGSKIIRYPREKEETDTQLALEYALEMNPKEIWIFGALGGRLDHAMANVSLLVPGTERGIRIKLVDEWCEVFVVTASCVIEGKPGQTVSLLPLSSAVTGITLEGFEYPLQDGTMEIGRPYGMSNRLIEARGVISVASGYLLVVRYFKAGVFPRCDLKG